MYQMGNPCHITILIAEYKVKQHDRDIMLIRVPGTALSLVKSKFCSLVTLLLEV